MTEEAPYRAACAAYWEAGWRGVLPLPPRAKDPPPRGWTGRGAPWPSWADVQAWMDGAEGAGNLALRLPDGLIGIDIDAYAGGLVTLAGLEAQLGPLPDGPWSSARDDGSGIRLLRVPSGRSWCGELGPGVQIIQPGHRYMVAWPSLHPIGTVYHWHGLANGHAVPTPDEVLELPAGWIDACAATAPAVLKAGAGEDDARDWISGLQPGSACRPVAAALTAAVAALPGGRHPAARDGSRALAAYGGEGHAGAGAALVALRDAFFAEVGEGAEDKRGAEWDRLLLGAVRLAMTANPTPRQGCNCALLAGQGVQFEMEHQSSSMNLEVGNESVTAGPLGLADALEARLLTAAQVRDIAPPAPLVEGLLCLDSECWLIARSGSFKTFVALDIGAHVAGGMAWMGRAVAPGPVLYLVAEGAGGMGPRVRAWEQRHGREMIGVAFLPMPIQVRRAEHWAALVEVCRRRAPVLIVLDTQARITVGLNENDNSEMGQLVEAIGQLRVASGACVLVVHHLGRTGQDARGASAIDGAQDSELKLTRVIGEGQRVTLRTDKQRHLPDNVEIELELYPTALDGGGSSLVVGSPLGQTPMPDWWANHTPNQATLIDVMIDIFMPVGATKPEMKSEIKKRGRRHPLTGAALEPMGESSFRRAWASLVAAGRFAQVRPTQRFVFVEIDREGDQSHDHDSDEVSE